MKHRMRIAAAMVVLTAGMGVWQAAYADIEATTPDGRRVMLRDNGTWAYIQMAPKETAAKDAKAKDVSAKDAKAKDTKAKDGDVKQAKDDKKDGELLLLLDRKIETGP